MRKVLIAVAALVVILITAIIVIPMLIPLDTYKGLIAQKVKEATGRELAIRGDVGLSLFPRIAIEVNDVSFANAKGARHAEMAKLEKLEFILQVLPLLGGNIAVDRFVLVKPVIRLEMDKSGRPNWEFGTPASKMKPGSPGGGMSALPVSSVRLGDVRLEGGTISYLDARSGRAEELKNVNVDVSLPSLESPFALKGGVTWRGEKVRLTLSARKLRNLLEGESTAMRIQVDAAPATFQFRGSEATLKPLRLAGRLSLSVPSIRKLAAWTGNPIRMKGQGLGPLSIQGNFKGEGHRFTFEDARIRVDKMNATGRLTLTLGEPRPFVQGKLAVDKIDLNPYLPPEGAKARASRSTSAAPKPAPWSDEPIDAGALGAADADLNLQAGGIRYRKIKIGKSALRVRLKNRILRADLLELTLYGGRGKGSIRLNATSPLLSLRKSFRLDGVQAEPLLKDAASADWLSGKTVARVEVSARGRSQRELVKTLNGRGSLKFLDGTIKGINIGAMIRNVKSAFLDPKARRRAKTDFAEVSTTFRIANGIVHNNDLFLKAPALRVSGRGTVDMPRKRVDYRVEPKLAFTSKGKGGRRDVAGLTVPVLVKGPWHDISYRPDLAGLIKKPVEAAGELLKKPGEILKKPGDLGKNIEKGVKGLLKTPGGFLKGLLNK